MRKTGPAKTGKARSFLPALINNSIWMGLTPASLTHGYTTVLNDVDIIITIEILYIYVIYIYIYIYTHVYNKDQLSSCRWWPYPLCKVS